MYDGFDEKNSLPYQVMVRPRGVEEVEVAGSVAPSREMWERRSTLLREKSPGSAVELVRRTGRVIPAQFRVPHQDGSIGIEPIEAPFQAPLRASFSAVVSALSSNLATRRP